MNRVLPGLACRIIANCLLVATVPGLQAQERALPLAHGFMKPDAATLRRWELQKLTGRCAPLARLSAAGALEGARSSAGATLVVPPTAFSLLACVPDSSSRDQGTCGSCWVWAATAMTEVALKSQYNIVDRLSIQYFQSNDTGQVVCNGGTLTEFCDWYNASDNPEAGVLVPWSNLQGGYADGSWDAYQLASTVAPGSVGLKPHYSGLTLNHQYLQTPTQAQAIANIQAALLNGQAVGFSFQTNFGAANGFDAFWDHDPETTLWVNAYENATEDYPDGNWGGHMVTIVGWDASDSNPGNHYWILLNQWGSPSNRPDGCFRLPMNMNYSATFTFVDSNNNNASTSYACYGFETLTLAGANPAGASASPTAVLASPAGSLLAGQGVTLAANVSAGSPPFTYQWQVDRGQGLQPVAGASNATLSLPNDLTPAYGVLDSTWAGQRAALTITNGAGSTTLGPVTLEVAGTVLNADSGFEAASATGSWSWLETTQSNPIYSSNMAYGGLSYARLTGYGLGSGNAGTFTSAAVTLPADRTVPVHVTYYLDLTTLETQPLVLGTCRIQVLDGGGKLLQILKTHTNMDVDHLVYEPECFDITALNQGGTQVAFQALWSDPDAANIFRLDNAQILTGAGTGSPSFTAFAPAQGAPGSYVTLTGQHFTGASTVVFGRSNAKSFSVLSDTQIQAQVPWDGATGPITVRTPNGTISSGASFHVAPSFVSDPNSYAYQLGSTSTELAPTHGAWNSAVQLYGLNFTDATGVSFGGVAASSFTVHNNTWITATVPSGAVTGPVTVAIPGGATASTKGSFTVAPQATFPGMAPSSGTAGSTVTLTGAGFLSASAVTFNGVASPSFQVVNDTTVTAQVPSGARSGGVTVVNALGPITSLTSFVVLAPTLASAASGVVGTSVLLTGSGFLDATAVTFDGVASPAFAVTDNAHLLATIPYLAASGAIPVTVTSPEGTSAPATLTATVPAIPLTATFSPSTGGMGLEVTLTGQYFTGTSRVTFNGASAVFTLVNDSQLRATVPAGASTGVIAITTPSGTWTSLASFTVNNVPQVTINQNPDGLLEATTFPFTSTVTGTLAGTVLWSVQEGAAGGTIDAQGLYTAPASPGTWHVVATSTVDPSVSATVAIPVHSAGLDPAAAGLGPLSVIDLAYFVSALGAKVGDPRYNALADFNGDGVIDDLDLALFLLSF